MEDHPAGGRQRRFVMHGRAVCNARKPECEKCCLKDICRTAREAAGQQAEP